MKKILLLALFFTQLHAAENVRSNIMILGGGGEPQGNETIFDTSLAKLGNYFNKTKWNNASVAFNGGHNVTETVLNQKFTAAENKGHFTDVNYKQIINEYTDKIGKTIKSGDQLLVYVYTHGGQRKENQTTHSISTTGAAITDTNNLSGGSMVSMDDLKTLTEKAKNNGVKLAIVDLSCHSGASLALANENTCVVSATGPNHLAYASQTAFGDTFVDKMTPGKNLEEIFLDARSSSDDNGMPMISTPENFQITKNLYDAITPYLYSANKDGDKLGNYLLKTAQSDLSCRMKREDDFKRINDLIDQIESINTVTKKVLFWNHVEKTLDLSELRASIKEYKMQQDQMLKALETMNTPDLKIIDHYSMEDIESTPLSRLELLRTDYDKVINDMQNDAVMSASERERNVRWFTYLKSKQTELNNSRPELKRAINIGLDFDKESLRSYSLASQVKNNEKKLYDSFYKHYKKENAEKSNPCRDFVL